MGYKSKYQIYRIQGNTCEQVLQEPIETLKNKRQFAYDMCGNYMPPTFEDLFVNQDALYVVWNDYRSEPITFINSNGEIIGSFDFVDVYMREYDSMIEKCQQNNDNIGIANINSCMEGCRIIMQERTR